MALEKSTAIHRDSANTELRFIPLLLADCDLPNTLRRYKYVDFRQESEEAFLELLVACRPESVEPPNPAPATPVPPPVEPEPKGDVLQGGSLHEKLQKGLLAAVADFREALCSVKNLHTRAKVAKLFGITSLDSQGNLDREIGLVLDCPKRDELFSRAVGALRALHDLLPATSEDDRRAILRLQKRLISRVFPIAQIRDSVERVMSNKGVISGAGATCIAPEYLTHLAAGLKPDFDYSGMMHLVRTPVGDSSPLALIFSVLLDISSQAGFAPEADSTVPITEERMLALARKLRASVVARANQKFIASQAPDDYSLLTAPLCYCVFSKLKNAEGGKLIHALIERIVAVVPELVFFELDNEADPDGHEHLALQYIGGPTAPQVPKF